MAAPTVRGRTAPVAGLSATSPAGTQIGDAVLVFTWEQAVATIPTHTLQSTFVEILSHAHDDGSTDGRLSLAYKIATSPGAVAYQGYTSSIGTTVRTGCIVLQVGTHSLGTTQKGAAASASATQTNNAIPNPPLVTLGTAREWLSVAIAGWHLGSAATVTPTAPTNYSNLQHVAGSSASEVASAERTVGAVASEDPGTFGDDVAPNGTAIITAGFPSPVERAAAVGATADIGSGGTFLSILARAAALDAVAAIASAGESESPHATHERAAAISATASIASSATFFSVFERALALAATGSIATAATFLSIFERALALAATAGIATDSERDFFRSASVAATGSISTSGTFFSTFERSASTSATGLVAVSGHREVSRSAAFDAVATISTDPERVLLRSASLAASANVAVSGQVQGPGEVVSSAHFSATAAISVSGEVQGAVERSASLVATGSVSVSGVVSRLWSRSVAFGALAEIGSRGVVPPDTATTVSVGHAPILLRPNIPRIQSVASARVRGDFQRRGKGLATHRTRGRIAGGSR